jgi:NitT/TauT family transport system ATP-binding protein
MARREIAQRFIAMVELSGFEHYYPKELSGGMKKRVDLARAYANDPELLLMDEPFGALDVLTRNRMHWDLLRVYDRHRKCVLFVTHDIEEALFLGDRVVVMTARPARVRAVVDVPFPRPRDQEIKTSPELQTLRRETMALLEDITESTLVEETPR